MLRKLGITAGLFAVAIASAVQYYFLLPGPVLSPPRVVSVRKGESLRAVARDLAANGIIRNPWALLIWAKLSGTATRVQPGDYAFKGDDVPGVMRQLVEGGFMTVTVTIPEGMTVHQIAERLEAAGLVCDRSFEDAARRGPLITALGLEPLGAEGYLFPATYRFSPRATTDTMLAAMLEHFYQILNPAVEEQMFRLGIDARELVTLASIVEKEAKEPGERPLIAGVFYNRLRLGMPLQSDPTAQYSLDGEISRAAIAVHTPSAFNTYTITGLPPGPIANPGLASIRATLYPVATDYLYFVARNDGTHVFSRSFNEHQRALAAIMAANRALERKGAASARARTE